MNSRCRHRWLDLYCQPNSESGFVQVYNARQLDAFKQCEVCEAIGKRNEQGTILQLPKNKWDNQRFQAARWAQNLETFAPLQEQECNSNLLEDFQIEQSEVNSNDWYTPAWLIEVVHAVMGGIDLDPASCARANLIVEASRFFSEQEDGLSKEWEGKVWLNPPYSKPEIDQFTSHLLGERGRGHIDQTCVLTRNATETHWCQQLLKRCDRFCLLNKRVSFWHPDKPVGTDKSGHILFYFGSNTAKFEQLLKPHGLVFKGASHD